MDSEHQGNTLQSSGPGAVSEWICPNCETRNGGDACMVCGCPRPVRENPPRKKHILLWILCAAALTALFTVLALWPRYSAYRSACELLENGNYALAYDAFSSMESYRDSREKQVESLLGWAESLAAQGQYSQALILLQDASSEPGAQALESEIRYDYATHLLNCHKYLNAYQQFTLLGDYPGAEESAWQTVMEWLEQTLENSDVAQAQLLRSTIQLTKGQSAELYNMLCRKPLYTDGGRSWNDDDFTVRGILLSMLADGIYPRRDELEMLFSQYDTAMPALFVRDHRETLEKLWVMPLGQNIITSDHCIYAWMVGTWWDQNYGKYMSFTVNDPDSWNWYYLTTNISMVPKPADAPYWNIWDMTLVWTNDDRSVSADVLELMLISPDTLTVFNYQDSSTYTLYRKP